MVKSLSTSDLINAIMYINLIRKQSNHCCKLFDNGSHRYELYGTEWLYPLDASGTGQAPSGTFSRDKTGFLILTENDRKVRKQATFIDLC